ncbi:hypothetical protein VPH35_017185 [Triticum aestivum]
MEMRFSAPVGAVHERAGDDGSNAVHSGSCRGALWWSLWYSSVAGQVRFAFPLPTLFSKQEEEGDLGSLSLCSTGDAPVRSLSTATLSFLFLLIFSTKESGAVRLDVPLEFDLVPFQIILCSAT